MNIPSKSAGLLCALALLAAAPRAQGDDAQPAVSSPNGDIEVRFTLDEGVPEYSVLYRGAKLIKPSKLGFELEGPSALLDGFELVSAHAREADNVWTQPWGELIEVRDRHNELAVSLKQPGDAGLALRIVFRVFDDGVAFRYELPEQPGLGEVVITDEATRFNLAGDWPAWWIPAFESNRYEYVYQQTPISKVSSVHTPVTLQAGEGAFVSIHEASLIDFASMALANAGGHSLKASLVPWSDGVLVRGKAPMASPWRTIQIADTAAELTESTMILNLNEPCKLEDTSWIEPGKYVGVWWEMHVNNATWGSGPKHGATTANVKRYIDFAAEHGFKGVLVEGWNEGWDGDWIANGPKFSFTKPYPDFDIDEVCRYARERGVYLIGHHETAGAIPNYEAQLDDALAMYERLGVRAVKTGYVDFGPNVERRDAQGVEHGEWHHGQYMVRHHQRVVEATARHKIMLVSHEPIKDTGLRRTWPNFMTREAARGQEYNAWSGDSRNPPDHATILPFTRMLSGPMDYTPGVFDVLLKSGDRPGERIPCTLVNQLALYVVIYSPMQMACDLPENYLAHMDAFQFIRDVPTDWQESRTLAGKIGDYLTVARRDRNSDDWYLGSVTDEQARELETPLTFLQPGVKYTAQIYRDADDADWQTNPTAYTIDQQEVDAETVLTLKLAPGGGQAIRFTPNRK